MRGEWVSKEVILAVFNIESLKKYMYVQNICITFTYDLHKNIVFPLNHLCKLWPTAFKVWLILRFI